MSLTIAPISLTEIWVDMAKFRLANSKNLHITQRLKTINQQFFTSLNNKQTNTYNTTGFVKFQRLQILNNLFSDGVEYSTSEYEYEYEYRKKLRVRVRVRVLILKNVLEYEYRKKVRVRVRVLLQV